MSTRYYRACKDCTPPHVHPDESDDTDGRGIAHSSGWWRIDPDFLDQDALVVNEYGEAMTVAEARKRTGR